MKLSYISVCNRDTYAYVSSARLRNVCMSIFMVLIIQNVHLEMAMWQLGDSVNAIENYSADSVKTAENGWTNWQISVPRALAAKSIREGNAGDEMANYLRLLFISFLLNISKPHKIVATFETSNHRNCKYVYHPIFILQKTSFLFKTTNFRPFYLFI